MNDRGITYDDILLLPEVSGIQSRLSGVIDLSTEVFNGVKIDYPIISSPMSCVTDFKFAEEIAMIGGVGIVHRFQEAFSQAPRQIKESEKIIFAYGIGNEEQKRLTSLYEKGARLFCLDVANGGNTVVGCEIKRSKDKYPDIKIMAGNVVTGETASYLKECGADAIRALIGNGSACSTSLVTGVGCPALTALEDIYEAIGDSVPIIADGGIKNSGQLAKAFRFGATSVMCGRILAGFNHRDTKINRDGILYKLYLGQASRKFMEMNGKSRGGLAPEGVDMLIPLRFDNSLQGFVEEFLGGLRSAMTYLNCVSIKEIRESDFIIVSPATQREIQPQLEI